MEIKKSVSAFDNNVTIESKVDEINTALFIGDSSFGISFGNGTKDGYTPEIIGKGSKANDAGIYILSIGKDEVDSNTPLIIFDVRTEDNQPIKNRPIFQIKNGNNPLYTLENTGIINISNTGAAKVRIEDTEDIIKRYDTDIKRLQKEVFDLTMLLSSTLKRLNFQN